MKRRNFFKLLAVAPAAFFVPVGEIGAKPKVKGLTELLMDKANQMAQRRRFSIPLEYSQEEANKEFYKHNFIFYRFKETPPTKEDENLRLGHEKYKRIKDLPVGAICYLSSYNGLSKSYIKINENIQQLIIYNKHKLGIPKLKLLMNQFPHKSLLSYKKHISF